MTRRMLYIVLGIVAVIIIIGVVSTILVLPALTAGSSPQAATPTVVVTPTVTATAKAVSPLRQALKQYGTTIKQQIAEGLHLTPQQLKSQLQSGKKLSDIATAQNTSADQLNTLVQNTFNTNLKPAIDSGQITQKQIDKLVSGYEKNQQSLERFLGAGTKAA